MFLFKAESNEAYEAMKQDAREVFASGNSNFEKMRAIARVCFTKRECSVQVDKKLIKIFLKKS